MKLCECHFSQNNDDKIASRENILLQVTDNEKSMLTVNEFYLKDKDSCVFLAFAGQPLGINNNKDLNKRKLIISLKKNDYPECGITKT